MRNYLITYEDAIEIAKRYNNNNFWEIQFLKNGYKLSSFNYFICGWDDFEKPLPQKPDINAFDMRGVTFVFNKDGSVWKRFLMLPKFFNINQVESTQYGNIKNKKIKNISIKEDGSLVAFMMLPDGKLFAKTIGSFASEQAESAYQYLYKWEEKVEFVKMVLNAGYTPLFEYVSGPNRIVLKYSEEDLRFLGLRDNFTGEWMPSSEMLSVPFNIPSSENSNCSLDELIEKAKTEDNKEGWVVMFEDGQMVKIKTAWYFNLHGLRTMNVFREDFIIESYLKETLDDIMSQLNPEEDKDAFSFMNTVMGAINSYIKHIDQCTYKLKEKFEKEYNSEWHYFAKFCNKEPYFGLARSLIETPDEYHRRRTEMILKKSFRLKGAKDLIDRWKEK